MQLGVGTLSPQKTRHQLFQGFADRAVVQWLSTPLWGLNDPFPGVTKTVGKTQIFALWFIPIAKLQLWNNNKNNFVVGSHQWQCVKGLQLQEAESHCSRTSLERASNKNQLGGNGVSTSAVEHPHFPCTWEFSVCRRPTCYFRITELPLKDNTVGSKQTPFWAKHKETRKGSVPKF